MTITSCWRTYCKWWACISLQSCPKMTYKIKFEPADLLCPKLLRWVPFERVKKVLDSTSQIYLIDDAKLLQDLGSDYRAHTRELKTQDCTEKVGFLLNLNFPLICEIHCLPSSNLGRLYRVKACTMLLFDVPIDWTEIWQNNSLWKIILT